MKLKSNSILRRFVRSESGQTLPFTAVILVSFLGLSGMAMDAGHGYYAYQRLKAATNAATLAGAAGMPDTSIATTNVATYSSATGKKNFLGSIMTNVVTTPSFACLNTVSTKLGVACQSSSSGGTAYNAISVTQSAVVKTWFGQFFGVPQFNISATSTAAMRGGNNTPWNVAIILDTTGSMNTYDSSGQCSSTQIQCATKGVQQLLLNLTPCRTGENCTSTSDFVDDVALYVFPPVLASTAGLDYCSGGTGNPTHEYYTAPTLPSTWTYQIINYSHDYKKYAGDTTLNTSSDIVKAVGYSGTGCSGIKAPGGADTYYAQVIYQAQADLLVQQAANPSSQNAIIILSDGDATACATNAYTTGGACSTKSDIRASSGTLNGTGTQSTNPNGYKSYAYPSALGECGQAVVAAQAATQAGTKVYTIGYNAEISGGCLSDKTYSASGNTTYGGGSWAPGMQPCAALAAMASSASTFYSVDDKGCTATTNLSFTTLTGIFNKIPNDFTAARLIPNGTT